MLARSAEACSARQRAESDGPKSVTGITSGLNMHQARHLFAMELRRVAGIEASSQALRHSDLSTTLNIHGHQDGSDLEAAMEKYAERLAAHPDE
jgi:integrase